MGHDCAKKARKDKLHQNYLKRKANGKQKAYEERSKAKKKAQIDSQKERIRAEDREKGIYFYIGVPNIPRAVSTEQGEQARQMMIAKNTARKI